MKQAKSNHQTFPMQPHSYCSLIRILLVSNRAHTGVSRERRVRLGAADWAPPIGHRRLGTADWAPPFGRWTFVRQTLGHLDYRVPNLTFLNAA